MLPSVLLFPFYSFPFPLVRVLSFPFSAPDSVFCFFFTLWPLLSFSILPPYFFFPPFPYFFLPLFSVPSLAPLFYLHSPFSLLFCFLFFSIPSLYSLPLSPLLSTISLTLYIQRVLLFSSPPLLSPSFPFLVLISFIMLC
uniref:Uncharacterized protein n=1 Tax=Cacopsylla melanoneura TaxID=428564 RepID=A0A8D8W7U3_9HEMI